MYSLWARIYDTVVDPLFHFDRRRVVKSLPKGKILEVGVGTGLNLPYYPSGYAVTGIDFSQAMLNKAKQKKSAAQITLKVMDASSMSFPDNTFDHALTTYVLRLAPEPKKILLETARVVKPGGTFVIVDQFKGKNTILLALMQPFKILLGWGKEYDLKELIAHTFWEVQSNKRFGVMSNTRLVMLRNRK